MNGRLPSCNEQKQNLRPVMLWLLSLPCVRGIWKDPVFYELTLQRVTSILMSKSPSSVVSLKLETLELYSGTRTRVGYHHCCHAGDRQLRLEDVIGHICRGR